MTENVEKTEMCPLVGDLFSSEMKDDKYVDESS